MVVYAEAPSPICAAGPRLRSRRTPLCLVESRACTSYDTLAPRSRSLSVGPTMGPSGCGLRSKHPLSVNQAWSLISSSNLTLRARWTIFLAPLAHVVQLPDVKGTPLRGCALCVAVDGTIAVVAVDSLEMYVAFPPLPLTELKLTMEQGVHDTGFRGRLAQDLSARQQLDAALC